LRLKTLPFERALKTGQVGVLMVYESAVLQPHNRLLSRQRYVADIVPTLIILVGVHLDRF